MPSGRVSPSSQVPAEHSREERAPFPTAPAEVLGHRSQFDGLNPCLCLDKSVHRPGLDQHVPSPGAALTEPQRRNVGAGGSPEGVGVTGGAGQAEAVESH